MFRFAPRALAALVATLLLATPALAKIADKDFAQAKKDLEQALASSDADATIKALGEVAADGTRRAAEVLVEAGISDKLGSPKVYDAILGALRGLEGEGRAALVDWVEHRTEPRQWATRCVLCDALSAVEGAEVTRALAGRLKDPVAYVVSAAARALGKRKDKGGVDALVHALGELEKKKDATWLDVRAALTAICGYDFETASEWSAFWASKKDSFDPEKDRGQ
ncbi:MAG TPA: hypothetical protein VHF22_05065, partial [Planctomycetota bacterium]|nr:hypothetical protein [Planctomycetota bacterium]